MKQLTLILILVPLFTYSQIIKGKIYDDDSTVKGVLIINLSQNDTVYSDTEGGFKIYATVNDSLMFQSFFHFSIVVWWSKNGPQFVQRGPEIVQM